MTFSVNLGNNEFSTRKPNGINRRVTAHLRTCDVSLKRASLLFQLRHETLPEQAYPRIRDSNYILMVAHEMLDFASIGAFVGLYACFKHVHLDVVSLCFPKRGNRFLRTL